MSARAVPSTDGQRVPFSPGPGTHRGMTGVQHVLLIEDDPWARRALRLALSDQGFQVSEAADGRSGLRAVAASPDIVLLDLVLPDLHGLEVLRRVRAGADLPLIVVSGRSDSSDVVEALQVGADDYVTKPVVAAVLSARIRALLRRAGPASTSPDVELRLGDLVLHPGRRETHKRGREIGLTQTEFRLLCELAGQPGQVVTREELLRRVWGYDYFGDTRLLDVHVRRLRAKIEDDPGQPRLVRTVRGVGYKAQP